MQAGTEQKLHDGPSVGVPVIDPAHACGLVAWRIPDLLVEVATVGQMGNLVVTTHEGVATVVIDHAPINLMTVPVFMELAETIDRVATDDGVRVVVLRSANPEWFIAHFDVAAILAFPPSRARRRPSSTRTT